jgi:hypothetical protein
MTSYAPASEPVISMARFWFDPGVTLTKLYGTLLPPVPQYCGL